MRSLGIGNRLAVGRAATSSGAAGILVKSYNFDGTSHLTSTYDPSTIGTGDISVSMWVKVPYLPGTTEYIWCLGNDDLSDTLALRIMSDKIQLFGQVGATGGVSLSAANTLLNDFWHHVVITRTGTTVELFINGTSQGSSINAEWAADLSGGETWFAYQGGAASFTGDIANIEIRSNIPTDSEIYNNFRNNIDYTTGTQQNVPITNNGATVSNSVIPLGWSNKHGFYFDGVNDKITIPDSANLSFGDSVTDSPFSISAWVYIDTLLKFRVISKGNSSTDAEYIFGTDGSSKLALYLRDQTNYIGKQYNTLLTTGTWHHVGCSYDGSGTIAGIELYVDGVKQTNISNQSGGSYEAMHNTTGEVIIGATYIPDYAEGKIDELYLFNKELSEAEFATAYNADTPSDVSSIGNVVYYLHEGSGADWSGNNNLATLQSGATASSDVPVLTIPDWVNEHSLDFNGTDQYGVIKDANALSFGNGSTDSPFSISVWVKFDSLGNSRLISKRSGSTTGREYQLSINSDKIQFTLYDQSVSWAYIYAESTTALMSTGVWYNIVATYDGSANQSGLEVYLNGVNVTNTQSSSGAYTAMEDGSSPIYIGSNGYDATYDLDGKVASAGIWSAELDADAAAFLAANADHDLNTDSGNYDYSANIVAAHAIETGFGPFVIDSSGNGHHANSPSGAAPTWTTDVPPDTRSIDLDGTDDIVVVSDNDIFSFGNGSADSAFSVVIICKMENDDRFRAINKAGSTAREWALGTNASGQPYFQLWSGGGSTIQMNVTHNGVGFSSDQGSWVMYAGTYDGSGDVSGLYIYRNGVDVSDTRLNNIGGTYVAMSNTTQDVQIGKGYGNIIGHGKIFTAGIWNGVLTAAELVALWNSGDPIRFNADSGDYTSSSDLIEEWPMNEGSGNTAAGVNGYDATLTPTGEPLWTLDVPQ